MKHSGKVSLVMVCVVIFILESCASSGSSWDGPVTAIYIGHHYPVEMAITNDNPGTMKREARDNMSARRYAQREVLNKLGVRIEWVQYSDLIEEIPNGSASGQMFDLVRVLGNTSSLVEAQLLQPIDRYSAIFSDDQSSWMLWPEFFGHRYFVNIMLRAGPDAPLVYNIGMLDKVPALKENGQTVLPVHLWQQGNWTWSVFEDYLQKVHDYWSADWDGRMAWNADIRNAAIQAIWANGGHVYNNENLGFASQEAKEAVAFIERLRARRLLRNPDLKEGTSEQADYMDAWRFQWGHSVFANLRQWLAPDMVDAFNERRERMGIVPFPRPDWRDANDPAYRQVYDATDGYAVPINVSDERAELALRAIREYSLAYHRRLAGSDNAMDYLTGDKGAAISARRMYIDISSRAYGAAMLEVWKAMGANLQINEFAINTGMWHYWGIDVLGDSVFGLNDAESYSEWADQQLPAAQEMIDRITNAADGG